jgi:peptidoglycan/LPS O-acetylase OafA/YrhL
VLSKPDAAIPLGVAQRLGRYRALDGLRGVAAASVVLYHALLVVPAISVLYVEHTDPGPFSVEWWLYRTPLRLVTAGHEAVLIFFVLSGFVLTLPLLTRSITTRSWLAYYARRLCRLYLPVWGAIVFAFGLAALIQRDPSIGGSWLATHVPPTIGVAFHDSLLILGTSNLDSPLWSLTWEIWFSLLLPALYFLVRLTRMQNWWKSAIIALIAVSAISRFSAVRSALPMSWLTGGLLQYLPLFGIGIILAIRADVLARYALRLDASRYKSPAWISLSILAILLTASPTIALPNSPRYGYAPALVYAASLVGVVLIVFLAISATRFTKWLESPVPQWAGSRSFSLYLVHEPILVALALVTRADGYLPWLFIAVAAIPLIIFITEGFYRLVEHPAHRLSRAVGRGVLDLLKPRQRGPDTHTTSLRATRPTARRSDRSPQ